MFGTTNSDYILVIVDQSVGLPFCYLWQFRHRHCSDSIVVLGLDGILLWLQVRIVLFGFEELIFGVGKEIGRNRV